MLLISYDISDDKLRTEFSKYIKQYGYRLQYSLYEISNSERFLNNIMTDIKQKYSKKFCQSDSILIIKTGLHSDIIKFGYLKNDDSDIIIV